MKKSMITAVCIGAVLAACLGGAACSSGGSASSDSSAYAEWKSAAPNEYQSWVDGGSATYTTVHKTGKINAVHDTVNSTEETEGLFQTPCLTCHSTQFDQAIASGDTSIYHMDTNASVAAIDADHGITCEQCHTSTDGSFGVASTWIEDAAKKGGITVDDKTLVCMQCHSLADFGNMFSSDDTSTWSSLQAGTAVDNIYKYFVAEGQTAPRLVGYQYNVFVNGTHEQNGATCADCHMKQTKASDGTTYTNHIWQTVRDDESLYDNCSKCHSGGADGRKTALETYEAKFAATVADAQSDVTKLSDAIGVAESAGKTEAQLADAQADLDKATFYIGYIANDGSHGFHTLGNTDLVSHCVKTSQEASAAGLKAVQAIS